MNKQIMWPAVKLMGSLNYKNKFFLIFIIFLVPLLVLSLMLLNSLREATEVTRQEQRGIEYLIVANSILKEVTNHRGMQVALLQGNSSFSGKLAVNQAAIDKLFVSLMEVDKKSRAKLALDSRSEELLKSWNTLKQTQAMSIAEVFESHKKLVADLKDMNRYISLSAQLVLDPEIGSYLLTTLSFNRIPALSSAVANLRRISSEVAFNKMLPPEDATRLAIGKEVVLSNLDALEFELKSAYQADPLIRTQLETAANGTMTIIRNYLQFLDHEMTMQTLSTDTERYFNEGTVALDKVWALDAAVNPVLDATFVSRLMQQQMQEWTAYSLVGLVLLVTAYLFIGFYLAVHQAIARVAEGAWAFASGNLGTRIEVEVRDEMANIATSFNAMAGILEERAQLDEREQREEMQKSADLRERLAKLSAHIENVASGDLSERLSISGDDDLARLAANLNMMTESLADVASGTTEAINTIYSAVGELQQSIAGQSSGASEQAAAVNETTAALDQIKGMAAQAMERVQMLGETAERSRRESELGGVAVEQAISGMAGILHRMEGIAQTILALSEQIQQIGEITGVVTNLAQQSKMLALNASIEAAKAGEAGKGFAVVAAEVRELAEQSQQSTAQVQKILQDIRHATDRAVMATEEGSKGVDAGMLSVQRSGDVMRQLNEVVRETAIASHQITAVVKQQFLGLEQVTNAMKDINKVTAQFVGSTQQSKESSAGISKVADRLRDSVSVYKL
ncbi:MAG: methyl-accepting chemotaxis protein [Gallionella sp.]|nr:methyl-accepting chemotaxis protein [Gallionella sp.]